MMYFLICLPKFYVQNHEPLSFICKYELSGQFASPVRENSVLSFLQDEDTVPSIISSLYQVKESEPL